MAQLTWVPGIILMAAAFALTYYCTYLLSRVTEGPDGKNTHRPGSYVEMCRMWIGKQRTNWLVMPFLYAGIIGTYMHYRHIVSAVLQYKHCVC